MPDKKIIRIKKPSPDNRGEIRHAIKDVRLMAVRGADRLPSGVNVTLLYFLLYDPDSRVRSFAQQGLIDLNPQDVAAFADKVGHPKVLDFLAHHLPGDSESIKALAESPNLPKRTLEYLETVGVIGDTADEASSASEMPLPDYADAARDSGSDSREWTPEEDVDLPNGVEFDMPTEDEAASGHVARDEVLEEEKDAEPDDAPDEMIAQSNDAAPQVEQSADTPAEEPEPEEEPKPEYDPEPVEETKPEKETDPEEEARDTHVEQKRPEEGLFPVYSTAPAEPPPQRARTEQSTESARTRPKKIKETTEPPKGKIELLRGIIVGLLVGLLLVAAFVAVDYFVPDWAQKVKEIKIKWSDKAREG